MDDEHVVDKVNEAPDLWIERLVIYGNYRMNEMIRDVPFSRGLNIVWGVSQTPQNRSDAEGAQLVGHSVGKTSLCRLIRYALDEDSFGQAEAASMIRERFPDGAVGVTVQLKGARWSVLRKFSTNNDWRAAENVTIEELSHLPPNDCNYSRYAKTLRSTFTDGLPGYGDAAQKRCAWHDLLAWMTRDQEARYQYLWKWRDHRSNAEKQELGQDSALKLMRSVLGLYSVTEESLSRDKESLTDEQKAARKARDQAQSSLEARRGFTDGAVKSILDAYGEESDIGNLFGLDSRADLWLTECGQRIKDLDEERERVRWELAGNRADEQAIQKTIDIVRMTLRTLGDGIESDSDEQKLKKLEQLQEDDCRYGEIPFGQCEHFQKVLNTLRDPFNDMSRKMHADRAGDKAEDLKEEERSWIAKQLRLSTQLGELREAIRQLEARERELDDEIVQRANDVHRVRGYREDREALTSELSKAISDLDKRMEDVKSEIRTADRQLAQEHLVHKAVCDELERLFNRLIQRFLSPQYMGRIQFLPVEKLDFRIHGMKGEAVQTFTCIMADIAAMMWSVEGKGYHPRFLIHDSPREADLSGTAYASFLQWMHKLSESLGGKDAPFQYIVTTTTSPPEELDSAGCVRLKLRSIPASDMLFGDNVELTLAGMRDDN